MYARARTHPERFLIVPTVDEVGGRLSELEDEESHKEDEEGDGSNAVEGVPPACILVFGAICLLLGGELLVASAA